MRLKAHVRFQTGGTRHYGARVHEGQIAKDEELPTPDWVEIVPTDGAFLLLYLREDSGCLTDTWHETLEQAKAQARHEFGIGEDDWEELTT